MTAAQIIAITIFLFNFFSDSLSAASRLAGLLPAEKSANDTFFTGSFCSVVCTDTGASPKIGFDATSVSTALRTSALSDVFTETDFSLATGFSGTIFLAARGFVRVLSAAGLAACIFTDAATAGFAAAFAVVFFAAVLGAVFAVAFTSAFFTLALAGIFALVFFAPAFSSALALAVFAAGF